MNNIVITGANGFIGSYLGKTLQHAGYNTIAVVRSSEPEEGFNSFYYSQLGEPISGLFENEKCDCIIHCANAKGRDDYELNVAGTEIWAEQGRKNGVKSQIFLSSISALQENPSSYGKSKRDTEKWFMKNDQLIIRLGMVIGNGGIFDNMKKSLKKYPIIPLLDNGSTPVYYTGVQRVCDIVKLLIQKRCDKYKRILNIQQSKPVQLKKLMKKIKKRFNYHCTFIPVPSNIILVLLLLLEKLNINFLPISSNNIKGLQRNKKLYITSDYEMFGFEEQHYSDLIEEL